MLPRAAPLVSDKQACCAKMVPYNASADAGAPQVGAPNQYPVGATLTSIEALAFLLLYRVSLYNITTGCEA